MAESARGPHCSLHAHDRTVHHGPVSVLCKAKSKAMLVSVAQWQRQALLILMFVVAHQQQQDRVVSIAVFTVQRSMHVPF